MAGFSLRDWSPATKNYQTELRKAGPRSLTRAEVERIRARSSQVCDESDLERREALDRIVADYRTSEEYKLDAVALLRPDIEQSLAQVHDYRSLITQIIQNVNVLLQFEQPGVEIDEQLSKTSSQIRSIYWAARLMEFKLKGPLFLLEPAKINDSQERRLFRLHGAVTKYLAMYDASATSRNVTIRHSGTSFGQISANPDAIGVIYHAFIDNALKYAPSNSEVVVHFEEDAMTITMSVTSKGPPIAQDERERIFDLYYRGKHAKSQKFEGTGFGLGMAQHVASHVGAVLSAEQEPGVGLDKSSMRSTKFKATFSRPTQETMPTRLERTRVRARGGKSTLT